MTRFFRVMLATLALGVILFPTLLSPVLAQSLGDILNLGNKPLNYDSSLQLGRGFKEADSIDSCLLHKEFNFNEIHNVWVKGLVRCKVNSKGVLSKATPQGISTEPADEQACARRRDGDIIVQGTPSEDEARRWSERCSYLGTVGGAGPIPSGTVQSSTGSSSTTVGSPRVAPSTSSTRPSTAPSTSTPTPPASITDPAAREAWIRANTPSGSSTTTPTSYTPVYTGRGVQVPSEELIPQGISRKKSLSELIIFYTNVTLPYVSVVAVFAFVASGIFYILSFANEELSGKAKTIMTYVVIGIVIIFSAYTVVNTLLSFVTFE